MLCMNTNMIFKFRQLCFIMDLDHVKPLTFQNHSTRSLIEKGGVKPHTTLIVGLTKIPFVRLDIL